MPPFDILRLGRKNLRLMRPVVDNYTISRESLEQYSEGLFEMLTSGKVNVAVHGVYKLKDVASAHQDLEGRKTTGKVLLGFD